MFTGQNNEPGMIRELATWNNHEYATIDCNEYTTINDIASSSCNPWASEVPVEGTDGFQFQPNLDKNSELKKWVPELMRTIK